MAIPFNDVADAEPGAFVGDLARDIAIAARDGYCELYRTDPLGVTSNDVLPGVGAAIRSLSDSLCRKIPPVEPYPPQQPSGGQCPEVYKVDIPWSGYDIIIGGDRVPRSGVGGGGSVTGPISSIRWIRDTSTPGQESYQLLVTSASGTDQNIGGTLSATKIESYNYQLSLISGGEDNCGDPPVPPAPVPFPYPDPPIRYVPIPNPSPGGGFLVVPVFLRPNFTLAPELNIQVGELNVNFNFNGEIKIAPNFNFDVNYTPTYPPLPPGNPNNPPTLPPGGGGSEGTDCPDPCPDPCPELPDYTPRFDDIDEALKQLLKCACDTGKVVRTVTLAEDVTSGVFTFPDVEAIGVAVNLTVQPSPRKSQYGASAPDVLFTGWYSFAFGGQLSDRKPISYASNWFPVEPEVNGFSFTLTYNARGTVTLYYLEEETP